MTQQEFIGMLVLSLASLVGLLSVLYKPLKDNTKAMTTLTLKVEELTKRMDEQKDDFEGYKDHVSKSQKRQWDVINKQGELLIKHDMEIVMLKGEQNNEEKRLD